MLTEPGLSLCQADHIMADEFSAELADGVAFVSGHDDDGRPVVVRHYCAGSLRLYYCRTAQRIEAGDES